MAKDSKTQAEIYREERKARIAKANKKNAKSAGSAKLGSLIKKIVALVICLAIVCGIGYYVADTSGLKNRVLTAATVGGEKLSAADFYYYYYLSYQNALSMQSSYSSYGINLIDENVSPDEQDYPYADDDGNTRTWAEELKSQAATRAQSTIALYNEAVKAGVELDEEELTEINETITSLEANASSSGYSLNAYLKRMFGYTKKQFEEQLKVEQLATKFNEMKQTEFADAVTEDDLKAELKANPNTYGLASIRYYSLSYETLTQKEGEDDKAFETRQDESKKATVKEAHNIANGISTDETFKSEVAAYEEKLAEETKAEEAEAAEAEAEAEAAEDEDKDETLQKNISHSTATGLIEAKGADWAFSADRKAGDCTVIEGENGAHIVYIVSPKSLDAHSVSVRYCLIAYNEEFTSAADEDEREAAKDEAETLYSAWKKGGDLTEDSFATLCMENSDDSSTSADGGLLEEVRLNSMVSAFEDWCFDSARKPGETAVIEAEEYGYFLVYFVKNNKDDLDWKKTAKESLGDKAYDEYYEGVIADEGSYPLVNKESVQNSVVKAFCKVIKRNLSLQAASN